MIGEKFGAACLLVPDLNCLQKLDELDRLASRSTWIARQRSFTLI
jgi:hypothetical protein